MLERDDVQPVGVLEVFRASSTVQKRLFTAAERPDDALKTALP